MRKFIEWILNFFKSEPPKPSKPKVKRPDSLIGYGCAWDWHMVNPTELANTLNEIGCNITVIEIDFKKDPKFVAEWVKPFRERNIWVEIIIVNSNTESARNRSNQEFTAYFNALKKELKTVDLILMHPVTEPGNRGGDKGKLEGWMRYVYSNWGGETVLSVRDGWFGQGFRTSFKEVHWCKELSESSIRTGAWITTTDCTPLINIHPDKVYSLAKKFLKKKANFIYYHADWHHPVSIDYGKLDAIRRAIQETI